MKLKRILVIVLFLLFLDLSISYTQENDSKNTDVKTNDSINLSETVSDKLIESEKKIETQNDISDSGNKKKTVINGNKTGNQKNSNISSEKKFLSTSGDAKPKNISQENREEDLLLINEGNFKYKRIPEIKLIEKKSEIFDSTPTGTGISGNTQNETDAAKMNGFFGLGKTTSDIIVKGGTLLLILLIFILYKARMSVPGRKSSKKRNVLNSFRK